MCVLNDKSISELQYLVKMHLTKFVLYGINGMIMCLWNCSKEVETNILTLSSCESQSLSTQNRSRSRYGGSASARKSRKINARNKQVRSCVSAW